MRVRRVSALLAGLALVLAACGTDEAAESTTPEAETEEDAGGDAEEPEEPEEPEETADDWDPSTVTMIIPLEPGGGTDTGARQIQERMEETLGANIRIEYFPGADMAIGSQTMIRDGDECDVFMAAPNPQIQWTWLLNDTEYDYEDFYPLGTYFIDAGLIRVANDAPWDTIEELIDDAIERPGEILFSTASYANPHYVALLNIQEATGAEFNIIDFDGGGPARTAVVSGEVDATHAGVFNSLPAADDTRVLTVHADSNDWPDLTDNAPTINDALGLDLRPVGTIHTMWTSTNCYEDFPERHAQLSGALEAAVTSDAHREAMEELGEEAKILWMTPDEMDQTVRDDIDDIRRVIAETPELEEAN